MQSLEASSEKKTRKPRASKPKSAPDVINETDEHGAPQFGEPGTPVSIPEDREHAIGDVEKELEDAETLLDAPPGPPAGDDSEAQKEPNPLEEMIALQTESLIENQISSLLVNIECITTEHSNIARANGFHAIASDLISLRNAGRHIAKRLNTSRYWVKK